MIYIDCESAGLRGEVFSLAMVNDEGETVFNGYYHHPAIDTNQWLAKNVKPGLNGILYDSKEDFLDAAAKAWLANKGPAVAHMGSPVESNFFQELWQEGLIGEFDGPYPLHDTAPLLLQAGYNPLSELDYADENQMVPTDYTEHSALSDARLTRLVWKSLI